MQYPARKHLCAHPHFSQVPSSRHPGQAQSLGLAGEGDAGEKAEAIGARATVAREEGE